MNWKGENLAAEAQVASIQLCKCPSSFRCLGSSEDDVVYNVCGSRFCIKADDG